MRILGFGSKKPQGEQPAQGAQKPPKTALGMLKSKADKGSTVGTLRDRQSQLEQQLKDAGI